jgi:hypothetical protein
VSGQDIVQLGGTVCDVAGIARQLVAAGHLSPGLEGRTTADQPLPFRFSPAHPLLRARQILSQAATSALL